MKDKTIKQMFWYCLKERQVECFMLIGFCDGKMINIHEHSRGNENQCKVDINAVLSFCTRHNINELYVAHNHIHKTDDWSFEVKPSVADINTIAKLETLLNANNIKLMASYIVTAKNVVCHLTKEKKCKTQN